MKNSKSPGADGNTPEFFLKVYRQSFQTILDFRSGRFIWETSRPIYDIMHYAKNENIPGLLILIDFEKALDTIPWTFIEHVLEKTLNFGKDIQKWVHLFQNNIFFSSKSGRQYFRKCQYTSRMSSRIPIFMIYFNSKCRSTSETYKK